LNILFYLILCNETLKAALIAGHNQCRLFFVFITTFGASCQLPVASCQLPVASCQLPWYQLPIKKKKKKKKNKQKKQKS
jgi:hypothetical protein